MALVSGQQKIKLKKDDTVRVIAGKDKGKTGRILGFLRKPARSGSRVRVLVEGINIVKKAKKARSQQDRGGIIEIEAPLDASNVMIICKKCGPTRIGYKGEGKDKKRVCKKCGEAL
jgi:large subunit ribosomal protein L24